MAKKTKEESQLTRDHILDAAENIFLESGISGATVAQIADKAHVSRGAVYSHYKNKVDICVHVCRRAIRSSTFPSHCLRAPTELARLHDMGMHMLHLWLDPGPMQRVMRIMYFNCPETQQNAPILHFRRAWERLYGRKFRAVLRRAIQSGEIPPTLDMAMAGRLIDCTFTGIYHSKLCRRSWMGQGWEDISAILHIAIGGLCRSAYLHGEQALPPMKENKKSSRSGGSLAK